MADPIKVLIVDDSRLFRAALEDALAGQEDIRVIGSVFSGAKALEFIRQSPPHVVTLDVEMPGMNGVETLEQIQALIAAGVAPASLGVVMVSAFTRRGADITVKALEAGAFDFVTKPSASSPEEGLQMLRDEVLPKIRACARRLPRIASAPFRVPPVRPTAARPSNIRTIVIGASTGGPRALSVLLPDLCSQTDLPILLVQHMPAGFTASLAESLARQTKKRVVEAADGMPIEKNSVYIAPGGRHLLIRGNSIAPVTGLTDQPPENGCRPSADVLFRSAATCFGSSAVAVILTGMGRDGTVGLGALKRAGARVFAQDQETSVVWGMPGSAVEAGVADEVLPLPRIAPAIAAFINQLKA